MFTDLMEKDIKKQFLDLIKSIDITSEILDDIIQEIKNSMIKPLFLSEQEQQLFFLELLNLLCQKTF